VAPSGREEGKLSKPHGTYPSRASNPAFTSGHSSSVMLNTIILSVIRTFVVPNTGNLCVLSVFAVPYSPHDCAFRSSGKMMWAGMSFRIACFMVGSTAKCLSRKSRIARADSGVPS
jgi:hypothetical protein